MNRNSNGFGPSADNRTPKEVIRDRIEMLAAVFNKQLNENLVSVWQDALDGYPVSALKAAFTKAERSLERFPTPKIMREFCKENMPSEAWKYHYEPKLGQDPETGKPIRILIDPNPLPGHSRELYRAADCPEGREFLATLRKLAGKPAAG